MFEISNELECLVNKAENKVSHLFGEIERTAFINQKKVLAAFNKNRVSTECFNPTTGYGYDDMGRDVLDKVWADVFEAESAFVRHSIASGTNAIAIALFGILRPGDTMLSVTGTPYDTLHGVIGIGKSKTNGSLIEFGVKYEEIELKNDSLPDLEKIIEYVKKNHPKMVYLQKSPGYSTRNTIPNEEIAKVCKAVKNIDENIFVVVDNCYGEFVEEHEICHYGVDIAIGSLIKNPGGGMAESGAYIAGKKKAVQLCAERFTCPGIGLEVGATLGHTKSIYKGLFYAPHTVKEALKTAVFAAALYEEMGFIAVPKSTEKRYDIIQQIRLENPKNVEAFCRGLQSASPIDSHVVPIAWEMPGYDDPVIMAAGAFVQGSSIELSADAPMRSPYTVYMQGGLTYESAKIGIIMSAQEIMNLQNK